MRPASGVLCGALLSVLSPEVAGATGTSTSTAPAERCVLCHANAADLKGHADILPTHPLRRFGCTTCHHGDGSADRAEVAHAPPGIDELLTKQRVVAACGSCHVPGAVLGTEVLVRGAQVYLELGCQLCHRGRAGFGSLQAFAPPLESIGARGSAYLSQVIARPASLFKDTVMPSFEHVLLRDPKMQEALLTYLLSLRGPSGASGGGPGGRLLRHSTTEPCRACHSTSPAQNRGFERHRCALIRGERETFTCRRCHAEGPPGVTLTANLASVAHSDGECLYVAQRRRDCGVCHAGGVDGQ